MVKIAIYHYISISIHIIYIYIHGIIMGVINQETSLRLSQLVASLLPTGFVHGPYMKQIPTLMEHKRSNLRVSLHMFLFPNISRTQLASFKRFECFDSRP